jgi:hypothetical protein
MGKRVIASDFLNFPAVLAAATVTNSRYQLDDPTLKNFWHRAATGLTLLNRPFGISTRRRICGFWTGFPATSKGWSSGRLPEPLSSVPV